MRRLARACAIPLLLASGLAAAGLGIGCSRGGGGGSAATGSVAVLVTDAPSDAFDRIELRISRVELSGGAGRVELFSGDATVDLLALEAYTHPFFVASGVPVGAWQKLRLTLLDVALIRETDDGAGGVLVEEFHPKLPGNGELDLVPRGSFFVVPGETLVVEIDVDAQKAVRATDPDSDGYGLRPVAFVRVVEGPDAMAKLSRIHGEIREFLGPWAFVLCTSDVRATRLGDETGLSVDSCLTVNLFDDTGIFDEGGDPQPAEGLEVGDPVTALGRLQVLRGGSALSTTPGEGSVAEAYSLAQLDGAEIQLDAVVVEEGPFEVWPRLPGTIATPPDATTDRFDFDLASGSGLPDPTTLPVQLQAGTAVLSPRGFRLPDEEIVAGVPAEVDGVLDPSAAPTQIKAALVLIGVPADSAVRLPGEVVALDPADRFDLAHDGLGECVAVGPESRLLLVADDGVVASATRIGLEDLVVGQRVEAFGAEGAGCFEAEVVVAFTD